MMTSNISGISSNVDSYNNSSNNSSNILKHPEITADIVIIGGGIAGLFALNRLRQLGFSVVLLESNTLGGGQTIKSQGIIHGGLKFALTGFLNRAAKAVESMPNRWKACLEGKGEVNLNSVKILSRSQLLWSTGNLNSELTGFFASLTLKSRVKKLKPKEYPTILQNTHFQGSVFHLDEIVLDAHSLIKELSYPHEDYLIKIDPNDGCIPILDQENKIRSLKIQSNGHSALLEAKHYLFAAGQGNAEFSSLVPHFPAMQVRPLQMVVVKFNNSDQNNTGSVYTLYGHCIDQGSTPRITITSHIAEDGTMIWYLGGQIAEAGIQKSSHEQIQFAKQELNSLFPWVDFNQAQFASFMINRAEDKQPSGKRPNSLFLKTTNNFSVAWPTKLALTPVLVDQFLADLSQAKVKPGASESNIRNIGNICGISNTENALKIELERFEKAKVALPVWEELFHNTHLP